MGRIVISTNVSLDGVVQDPDGGEGSSRGGWFSPPGSRDRDAWAQVACQEALAAEALLLGRRSYEWFAQRWPARTGEFADRLNGMPKYVVSSTLDDPGWAGSTVLTGDAATEVAKLTQELDGDILVYASYELGHTLLEHDLVDEVRLFVFPVVLGEGQRLFGPASSRKPLQLVSNQTVGDGLALLTYQPVRPA